MVCTGNLCRSPLAEALLRRDLDDAGIPAEVASAGLAAPFDRTPDDKLQRVAAERGVDVSTHLSQPLLLEHIAVADLVLVMTRSHARQVRELDPSSARRVVTLRAAAWKSRAIASRRMPFSEWVGLLTADVAESEQTSSSSHDIGDPIGRPLRRYREMAAEVEASVSSLVRHWPVGSPDGS
jgi:protein-tyrosine phosphatase